MVCASVMSQEYGLSRTHSGVSQRSHGHGSTSTSATSKLKQDNLLFGEIVVDGDSTRSDSICNLVLTTSSAFLRFWLNDTCREQTLSNLSIQTLPAVRLTCRDFAERAAPLLFTSAFLNFRASSLTRPARIAALERIGHHVQKFTFRFPHSAETFLPPLVDPNTGAQRPFTPDYHPQVSSPERSAGAGTCQTFSHSHHQQKHDPQAKYGSWELTDLLIRQYPPLFHAATNAPAFSRALEAMPNIQCLKIDCPGQDFAQRSRRSVVDYALISLRNAVEVTPLPFLSELILASMHLGGLLYLSPSPAAGFGAGAAVGDLTPTSAVSSSSATLRAISRWKSITKLTMEVQCFPSANLNSLDDTTSRDHLKLLHAYLRHFAGQLTLFSFRWSASASGKAAAVIGKGTPILAGPCPLTLDSEPGLFLNSSLLMSPNCYYSDPNPKSQSLSRRKINERINAKRNELTLETPTRGKILNDMKYYTASSTQRTANTNNVSNRLPPTPPATPTNSSKDGSSNKDINGDINPNGGNASHKASTTPPPSSSSSKCQQTAQNQSLHFPELTHLRLDQCVASVSALRAFFARHTNNLQSADFDNIRLHGGDWADATSPLFRRRRRHGRSQSQKKSKTDRNEGKEDMIGNDMIKDGSKRSQGSHEQYKKQKKRMPVLSFAGSSTMEVPIMLRLGTPDLSASAPAVTTAFDSAHPITVPKLRQQSPTPKLLAEPNPSYLPPATYKPASIESWIESSALEWRCIGNGGNEVSDDHQDYDNDMESQIETPRASLHPIFQEQVVDFTDQDFQNMVSSRAVPEIKPAMSLRYDRNGLHPTQLSPKAYTQDPHHQEQSYQQHTHHQLKTAISDPFITKSPTSGISVPMGALPPPPPPPALPPPPPIPQPTLGPNQISPSSTTPQHHSNNISNGSNIIPHTVLPPLDKLHQRNRNNVRKHHHHNANCVSAHDRSNARNIEGDGDNDDHDHNHSHGRCWLRRAKAPLVGCEKQVRKLIRGAALGWR